MPVGVSVSLVDIFLKRGFGRGLGFRTHFLMILLQRIEGEDEGNWVTMKGSTSKTNSSCLVYSFNGRLLLLQLRV